MTGKPFAGYAVYIPPGLSSIGEPIPMRGTIHADYPQGNHDDQGPHDEQLLAARLLPENPVLMNASDAKRLGLADGDM
jgi:hypothetical protein